jgi:hypothetical protein
MLESVAKWAGRNARDFQQLLTNSGVDYDQRSQGESTPSTNNESVVPQNTGVAANDAQHDAQLAQDARALAFAAKAGTGTDVRSTEEGTVRLATSSPLSDALPMVSATYHSPEASLFGCCQDRESHQAPHPSRDGAGRFGCHEPCVPMHYESHASSEGG